MSRRVEKIEIIHTTQPLKTNRQVINQKAFIQPEYISRREVQKDDATNNLHFTRYKQVTDIKPEEFSTEEEGKAKKIIIPKRVLARSPLNTYSNHSRRYFDNENYSKRIMSPIPKRDENRGKNVVSVSINFSNKTAKKPKPIHKRNFEIIQTKNIVRKHYINSKDEKHFKTNNQNCSIKEIKNTTKEQKTVADVPCTKKIIHRYNYNYVPYISNISYHSINASKNNNYCETIPAIHGTKKIGIYQPQKNQISLYNNSEKKDQIFKKYTQQKPVRYISYISNLKPSTESTITKFNQPNKYRTIVENQKANLTNKNNTIINNRPKHTRPNDTNKTINTVYKGKRSIDDKRIQDKTKPFSKTIDTCCCGINHRNPIVKNNLPGNNNYLRGKDTVVTIVTKYTPTTKLSGLNQNPFTKNDNVKQKIYQSSKPEVSRKLTTTSIKIDIAKKMENKEYIRQKDKKNIPKIEKKEVATEKPNNEIQKIEENIPEEDKKDDKKIEVTTENPINEIQQIEETNPEEDKKDEIKIEVTTEIPKNEIQQIEETKPEEDKKEEIKVEITTEKPKNEIQQIAETKPEEEKKDEINPQKDETQKITEITTETKIITKEEKKEPEKEVVLQENIQQNVQEQIIPEIKNQIETNVEEKETKVDIKNEPQISEIENKNEQLSKEGDEKEKDKNETKTETKVVTTVVTKTVTKVENEGNNKNEGEEKNEVEIGEGDEIGGGMDFCEENENEEHEEKEDKLEKK